MSNPLKSVLIAAGLMAIFSCKDTKETNTQSTVGRIEMYDKELLQLLDTSAVIEVLADGFNWSEGPLWLAKEHMLLFTDVPENTVYSWDEKNGKQVYLKPSGYTLIDKRGGTEGANGLALDTAGNLILCQHGNRAVAKMVAPINSPKDSFEFISMKFNGNKFNSPNDLHILKNGHIYFTDPPYGLPGQDQDSIKELSYNGVYRWTASGEVKLIDSTMTKPNGITFSNDERVMYVANSDPDQAYWKKFVLDDQENVVSTSIFSDVTHLVPSLKGLPDGMKINAKGYIFATGPGGVLIFSPDSRHLGTIITDQATANCALDSDQSYLYMTADDYLMRIKLLGTQK